MQAGGADGRWAGLESTGWWGNGLEGLAGPVKRFGLHLTDNAEPSQSFRQGRDMGSLAYQQDLPTHSSRNALDRPVCTEQAGGKGSRKEMVWLGLEQCMERSGGMGAQFKGYNWQAKDVGSEGLRRIRSRCHLVPILGHSLDVGAIF